MRRRDFLKSSLLVGGASLLPGIALAREPRRAPRLLQEEWGVPAPEISERTSYIPFDSHAFDSDNFELSLDGNVHEVQVAERSLGSNGVETLRFEVGSSPELSTCVRQGSKLAGLISTPEKRYVVRPLAAGWHAMSLDSAVPQVKRSSRRRAVRSGPTPETIEANWSFWYPQRLADFFGGEENTRLTFEGLVAIENTALAETGNVFFRLKFAHMECVDGKSAQGGTPSVPRPNYTALLTAYDSLNRFREDAYMRQTRFDLRLSFATYIDLSHNGIGSGSGELFQVNPSWMDGMAAILWSDGVSHPLIHEIGHNLGLEHDKFSASANICPFAYGWVDAANDVQDIMSLRGFRTIYHYSNPRRQVVDGVPFGDFDASDGARRINEVAPVARDFWRYAIRQW